MVSDRAFTFHMYIPWGKTFSLAVRLKLCQGQGQIIKVTFVDKWHLQGISVSEICKQKVVKSSGLLV